MPLFGLRTSKKNEQSQIQASASDTKSSAAKTKRAPKKAISKKSEVVAVAPAQTQAVAMPTGSFGSSSAAIIRPRITEKSGVMSQSGVYTFEISRDANKDSVRKAMKALYNVTAVKVGIVNIAAKSVFVRGKKGRIPRMKKAFVTVKKGEKIDFV
ncbi:MAG: 50S ribosomal protein L23 [Candidatus Paceibacterota bacterium]|jgi:large subunit ribosomal protein L23